jgi:hypothetical protein
MNLGYCAEVTWGTPVGAGPLKLLRYTRDGLRSQYEDMSSDEIVSTRQMLTSVRVAESSVGEFEAELSYGSLDDMLEAVMMGTWTTNVLVVGSTKKSFTFEKQFLDASPAQYHTFPGVRVDSLGLTFRPRDKVMARIGLIGLAPLTPSATTAITGTTAVNTNPVMNTVSDVRTLNEGGSAISAVRELNINITNNMRELVQIGSAAPAGIEAGTFEVTGNLIAYFNDSTLFAKAVSHATSALRIVVGGASTLKYQFDISSVIYTGGEVLAEGINQDVVASMEFRGIYNVTDTSTFKITRTP